MYIVYKTILILILFTAANSQSALAQTIDLSPKQIERVKVCQKVLKDADLKTWRQMAKELSQSPNPEENLQILEAITETYMEIVKEQNVIENRKKAWLYDMIKLNMAYLQLGGLDIHARDQSGLNLLIQKKLKDHLPELLKRNKKIFQKIEK